MANARSANFTLIDYSKEINLIPTVWSLLGGLDLFEKKQITETVTQVERVQEISDVFNAQIRGGDVNIVGSEKAETKDFRLSYFPMDRPIRNEDIQDFREYGTGNVSKTLMTTVTRIMARVKRMHAQVREAAYAAAIKGTNYNGPSGDGPVYNYYDAWGITPVTADVDFTDELVNPGTVIEKNARAPIIRTAQDGVTSDSSYSIIAWCGEEWFSALVDHPLVVDAFDKYESKQEPLRKRLGMGGDPDNSIRVFHYKGVTYFEDLSPNIAPGDAYILPRNMPGMFKIVYGPAYKVALANTEGQELYLWYKADEFNDDYKVESQASLIAVGTRPELVIKSTGTFA